MGLPLMAQVLLLEEPDGLYALPHASVERILLVPHGALQALGKRTVYKGEQETLVVARLASLLGGRGAREWPARLPLVVLAHGEQRDWTGLIHRTKRGDDMLLHLQGNDFLIAARGLPSREVAARVRRRLHHQLHELTAMACGPGVTPLRLHSAAFDPQQTDPGHVLARLLVALHAHDSDAPAARPAAGPGVKPARGSVPYTRSAPVTGE